MLVYFSFCGFLLPSLGKIIKPMIDSSSDFLHGKQNISGQSCEWILMNCPETSLWPGLSMNWSRSGSVSAGWSFLFLEEADRDLWASSTDWLVCEVSEVWGGGEAGGWGGKEKTGNCVSGAGGGSVYDLTEQEGEEKRAEKASFSHSAGGEETEKGSIDPRWSDSSSFWEWMGFSVLIRLSALLVIPASPPCQTEPVQ